MQKVIAFPHTGNEQLESEFKKISSFTLAEKKKAPGINLIKYI